MPYNHHLIVDFVSKEKTTSLHHLFKVFGTLALAMKRVDKGDSLGTVEFKILDDVPGDESPGYAATPETAAKATHFGLLR